MVKIAISAMQSLIKFMDKIFANDSRWRNWQKLSTAESRIKISLLYTILLRAQPSVGRSSLTVSVRRRRNSLDDEGTQTRQNDICRHVSDLYTYALKLISLDTSIVGMISYHIFSLLPMAMIQDFICMPSPLS